MVPSLSVTGLPHPEREELGQLFASAQQQLSDDAEMAANPRRPGGAKRPRKKFVLCFDGTGNKFSGTDADSNILKIYRMLDRNDGTQFHYYQPGIGTYVSSNSFNHTSTYARMRSAYMKAKDSAIGTSFAEHVMAGYRFLMRYYLPGDDIFFFGFSRGAYTARFLAEMLDHVGLLTAGNEEMCRFAWKTFQKWQQRTEKTDHEKEEKRKLLEFMCAFRETFSRPVRRIRFLGLFDTVNSVPSFENAWMQRSKFPYTARSTAKVIRHAVAIDERRAKFRQDLISEQHHRHDRKEEHKYKRYFHRSSEVLPSRTHGNDRLDPDQINRGRSGTADTATSARYNPSKSRKRSASTRGLLPPSMPETFRDASESAGLRSLSPGIPQVVKDDDESSMCSGSPSFAAMEKFVENDEDESDGEGDQDIDEVWFAGCHADIGGGWPIDPGVDSALSHVPLVWMVREAQRAGLVFDQQKLRHLNCCPDDDWVPRPVSQDDDAADSFGVPQIAVQAPSPPGPSRHDTGASLSQKIEGPPAPEMSPFHTAIHSAGTRGRIHDVLQFNNGLPATSVLAWKMMEYLPFRRMDLQDDGSWKSISGPLPTGETRDIPDDAKIHGSVIRRMQHDDKYRPGNLICGGGGRGIRIAPKELGMGVWSVVREEGCLVGEVHVRARPSIRMDGGNVKKILKRDSEKINGGAAGNETEMRDLRREGARVNGFGHAH